MGDLIQRLRDRASRFRGYVDGRGAASSELDEAADALEAANARIAGLEAARIAYASEFPPDAEGLPDVGSIHANIRAMKVAMLPDYERKFRREITELVMRHIDRMGDICEQDPAEQIIKSFEKQFDPIFDEYLAKKFPGREVLSKENT
jgi:hypothetical protein